MDSSSAAPSAKVAAPPASHLRRLAFANSYSNFSASVASATSALRARPKAPAVAGAAKPASASPSSSPPRTHRRTGIAMPPSQSGGAVHHAHHGGGHPQYAMHPAHYGQGGPPPPPPPPAPRSLFEKSADWVGEHPWQTAGIGFGLVGAGLLAGYGRAYFSGSVRTRRLRTAGVAHDGERRQVVGEPTCIARASIIAEELHSRSRR